MNARLLLAAVVLGFAALASSDAQSPMILQAVNSTPTAPAPHAAATATPAAGNAQTLLELVQQMQVTNAETLKKQEAALQTLDALQKAAEEIKIFSKRG